jgi:hypothetical protein
MKLWLTALCVLFTIHLGSGDIMAKSRKPVTKNGTVIQLPVVPYNDTGKQILAPGTRQSVGNMPNPGSMDFTSAEDLRHFLTMLQLNAKDRQEKTAGTKRPGARPIDIRSREERMRELFSGDSNRKRDR